MAAALDDYNPETITLDETHNKLQALDSRSNDDLIQFIRTRGQQNKVDLSEQLLRNTQFLVKA